MTYNVLGICDVGAFIERQTNQQQKAFFWETNVQYFVRQPQYCKTHVTCSLAYEIKYNAALSTNITRVDREIVHQVLPVTPYLFL